MVNTRFLLIATGIISLLVVFRREIGLEDFFCKLGIPRKGNLPCGEEIPVEGEGQEGEITVPPEPEELPWVVTIGGEPVTYRARFETEDGIEQTYIYMPLRPDGNQVAEAIVPHGETRLWDSIFGEPMPSDPRDARPVLRTVSAGEAVWWIWFLGPNMTETWYQIWLRFNDAGDPFNIPFLGLMQGFVGSWFENMERTLVSQKRGWGTRGHRERWSLGPWIASGGLAMADVLLEEGALPVSATQRDKYDGLMADYFGLDGEKVLATARFFWDMVYHAKSDATLEIVP